MTNAPQSAGTSRRRFLLALGAAGASAAAGDWLWRVSRGRKIPPPPAGLHAARRLGHALGTDASIVALHASQAGAERAIDAAFAELETIESVMSLYRPDSQICRLNERRELLRPHPYLVQVLRKAQAVSAASNGAFDVTVQPLWTLYANFAAMGRLPEPDEIERIRNYVDWRRVVVSDDRSALKGAGTAITLNGIAQGYAADRVLAALAASGVRHALVDTGEIGTMGRRADNECWSVGIRHPRQADALIQRVRLDGRCVATSGDYETAFTPDFVHNHIFDPHTGRSPQSFQSVSVVAKTGMEADALTKVVFVAGLERGIAFLEAYPGADGFFVLKNGQIRATAGFRGEV
jgi:thiamine biosynthesis lipoprotein